MILYLIPFITAFIGWITNWLLIKISLGNVSKKQEALGAAIGKLVSQELFHADAISDKLNEPGKLAGLTPLIETHIDTYLKVKLLEKMPFLATFIGDSTLAKIKEGMMEEIEALLPVVIAQYAGSMMQQAKIEQAVKEKIARMPSGKLEQLITSAMVAQITMLKIAGAVSGFIIGIIAVLLGQI